MISQPACHTMRNASFTSCEVVRRQAESAGRPYALVSARYGMGIVRTGTGVRLEGVSEATKRKRTRNRMRQ